jgi:hypothetical protein
MPEELSTLPESSGEWALAAVHDVVAAAVPDREMVVCGPVRRASASSARPAS